MKCIFQSGIRATQLLQQIAESLGEEYTGVLLMPNNFQVVQENLDCSDIEGVWISLKETFHTNNHALLESFAPTIFPEPPGLDVVFESGASAHPTTEDWEAVLFRSGRVDVRRERTY